MRDEFNDSFEGARLKQRAKRRKTNIILNSLILTVLVLIVLVAIIIFSGGDKAKTPEKDTEQTTGQENKPNEEEVLGSDLLDEDGREETGGQQEESPPQEGDPKRPEPDQPKVDEGDVIVEEGTEQSNIKQTTINPSWKPIGTEQTGEHITVFETDSVDWQEMVQALAYGSGLSEDNMTTWFIGNNGVNKAVGTVTPKDRSTTYRVYIEWVAEQGWKPTKVEELLENDKMKKEASEEDDEQEEAEEN